MAYDYSHLHERAAQLGRELTQEGWLPPNALTSLEALAQQQTPIWFADRRQRPLVVAFFGGTGVGKSTLLNRLAGVAIARTGVERPTSREVTVYHHRDLDLAEFPDTLPLQKIRLAAHHNERCRRIVWLDTPDFDSIDTTNRDLVLRWLPYIDVLVYVVSPERYRDQKAWRILQAEGHKHAWLFVMNQWDLGDAAQYEDFAQQLVRAGFNKPIVLKTICTSEESATEDDFAHLEAMIETLATQKTLEHLEARERWQQTKALEQLLKAWLAALGEARVYREFGGHWSVAWTKTRKLFDQALVWPLQQRAAFYAAQAGQLFDPKLSPQKYIRPEDFGLWDEWAQNRFDDLIDALILSVDQQQLPLPPFKKALEPLKTQVGKIIVTQTEVAARACLANPGNGVQRFALKITRLCEIWLPLIAMGSVGYTAVQDYYHSSLTHGEYLGTNFVLHSALLITLSWLLPFFIHKKIQPSLEKTALKGLKQGLSKAWSQIEMMGLEILDDIAKRHDRHAVRLQELIDCCATPQQPSHSITQHDTLARMLRELS